MSGGDAPSVSREARPRRTRAGTVVRTLLVIGGVVAALLVVIVATDRPHRLPSSAAVRPDPVVSSQPAPRGQEPAAAPRGAEPRPASPAATAFPELAARLDTLDESIVKIESPEPGHGQAVGSGFVISETGLVATSYHVLAETTEAVARFKNGVGYDIEGYAAVDTELDLAIVQLRSPPAALRPLELAGGVDPPRLSDIVAIGHPRGVGFSPFDGRVSRVLRTSELPPASQRVLRQLVPGRVDQRWIQHTAGISAGHSGGPLLNPRGQVVGINTWVDPQAHFGYALHVDHLVELLAHVVAHPPEPLRKYARQTARVADQLRRLTPEHLEQLWQQARARQWRPESEADYEALQELAFAITAVQLPKTFAMGTDDTRLDALTVVARRVLDDLGRQQWDAIGQVTIINEFATPQVERPMAGVFLFATVERVVEGDDGARGALLQMAGGNTVLFIPLDDQLSVPDAGQQCLVVGINYDGRKLRYGENPLRPITAHVIASRALVPFAPR